MMQKYTVGRSSNNDIIINDESKVISNNHLILEFVGSNIYITDTSTNGTAVNGKLLEKNRRTKLTFGTPVILANSINLDWSLVPKLEKPKINFKKPYKWSAIILLILILSVAIYFIMNNTINSNKTYSTQELYNTYNSSVVLVYHSYYYTIKVDNKILLFIGKDESGRLNYAKEKESLSSVIVTGSGFFIGQDGAIITNRHVVIPWNEKDGIVQTIMESVMFKDICTSYDWGNKLPEISGVTNFIGVAINNSVVSSTSNLLECSFVKTHYEKDVDLALINLKSNKIPDKTNWVNINTIPADSILKVGDKAVIIGFPGGLSLQDHKNKSIIVKAITNEGTINQAPGNYSLMYQTPSMQGASGSPVFNDKGLLIAVNYASSGANYNYGILAKYIKDIIK